MYGANLETYSRYPAQAFSRLQTLLKYSDSGIYSHTPSKLLCLPSSVWSFRLGKLTEHEASTLPVAILLLGLACSPSCYQHGPFSLACGTLHFALSIPHSTALLSTLPPHHVPQTFLKRLSVLDDVSYIVAFRFILLLCHGHHRKQMKGNRTNVYRVMLVCQTDRCQCSLELFD